MPGNTRARALPRRARAARSQARYPVSGSPIGISTSMRAGLNEATAGRAGNTLKPRLPSALIHTHTHPLRQPSTPTDLMLSAPVVMDADVRTAISKSRTAGTGPAVCLSRCRHRLFDAAGGMGQHRIDLAGFRREVGAHDHLAAVVA